MKFALKLVVLIVVFVSFSFNSLALNQGSSKSPQNLSNLVMRTGIANPEQVLTGEQLEQYHRDQHKKAFGPVLQKIGDQSKKIAEEGGAHRHEHVKTLLPREFMRPQILALAAHIGFSHADDKMTLGRKFIGLALHLRDIYDPDNLVSQQLGLIMLLPRLSQEEINYFVTEALMSAVLNWQSVHVAEHLAIDHHLSLAQIILWRIRYGKESLMHNFGDFEIEEDAIYYGVKSERLRVAALNHIALAEKLLNDPTVELPVVYHPEVMDLVKTLDDDKKYHVIVSHKEERDQKLETESENVFDRLEKFRGLSGTEKNPLDGFTAERFEKTEKIAQKLKLEGDKKIAFIYSTMKNFSLGRIKDKAIERYFTQEVLQRHLLKKGIISRSMLVDLIYERVEKMKRDLSTMLEHKVVYQ